jgi:hypothetical protein
MSSIDENEAIMSEDRAGQESDDGVRLVPVSESIRYRKRAQSAEKRIENLTEELAEARAEAKKKAEELANIRIDQKLTEKLAAVGTVDLETAVLVAKVRMEGQEEADVDGVIEQLKKEKQYLFGGENARTAAAQKTAGVKDRVQNRQVVLERAAKKAATTGNRTDLQEYLKLRRDLL